MIWALVTYLPYLYGLSPLETIYPFPDEGSCKMTRTLILKDKRMRREFPKAVLICQRIANPDPPNV